MKDQENLQEMQFLEQGLQNILFQKQAFQIELSETGEALKELENSRDEVFKVIGQLMIKSEKSKIKTELSNKLNIIELRLKNLEKQEETLSQKLEEIRDNLLDKN